MATGDGRAYVELERAGHFAWTKLRRDLSRLDRRLQPRVHEPHPSKGEPASALLTQKLSDVAVYRYPSELGHAGSNVGESRGGTVRTAERWTLSLEPGRVPGLRPADISRHTRRAWRLRLRCVSPERRDGRVRSLHPRSRAHLTLPSSRPSHGRMPGASSAMSSAIRGSIVASMRPRKKRSRMRATCSASTPAPKAKSNIVAALEHAIEASDCDVASVARGASRATTLIRNRHR